MNEKLIINPRHPLKASIASGIIPGFGQLYNGNIKKCLFIVTSIFVIKTGFWYAFTHATVDLRLIFWGFMALFICMYLFSVIDAGVIAKQAGRHYELRIFNKEIIYSIFVLACLSIWSVNQFYTVEWGDAFRARGDAMAPAFVNGDRFFTNNLYYKYNKINESDIVAFNGSNGNMYIGRVIATSADVMPGSTQEKVPLGFVYILGDNPNNKNKPQYGLVPENSVFGKVVFKYWDSIDWNIGII